VGKWGRQVVTDSGQGAQSTGNRGLVSNRVGAWLKLGAHSLQDCAASRPSPAQPSPNPLHYLLTHSMRLPS
jgi:hypothetical protein